MLVIGAMWLIPMRVRTLANMLLLSQMLLAYSTVDVFVVTAAIRLPDMYRFSVTSQQATCDDLALANDTADLFDSVPDPCFGAEGVLGEGFYWLIWPGIVQFWISMYVSYEAGGVIVDHVAMMGDDDDDDVIAPSPFDANERCVA